MIDRRFQKLTVCLTIGTINVAMLMKILMCASTWTVRYFNYICVSFVKFLVSRHVVEFSIVLLLVSFKSRILSSPSLLIPAISSLNKNHLGAVHYMSPRKSHQEWSVEFLLTTILEHAARKIQILLQTLLLLFFLFSSLCRSHITL